MKHTAQ